MLLSLVYFTVLRLLRLLSVSGGRDDIARDVELMVKGTFIPIHDAIR
jgi:hypothetical protein